MRNALRHEDANDVLVWINPESGASSATPVKRVLTLACCCKRLIFNSAKSQAKPTTFARCSAVNVRVGNLVT